MYSSPSRLRTAFTLLELIVVIVILGILAALAIPTFSSVIERSRDKSAETTLAAVLRDAGALAALRGETVPSASDISTAWAETTLAAAPGVLADAPAAPSTSPSGSYGALSYQVSSTSAGVAMLSRSGHCVMSRWTSGHSEAWSSSASGACSGDWALLGSGAASPAASPTTPTTPTAPAFGTGASYGLVATGGARQVVLTWDAVSGATSYEIARTSGTDAPATTTTTTTTGTTVTGLADATTYSFSVTALQGTTRAAVSSPAVSTTTSYATPAAPTNLVAKAGSAQVDLSWTPAPSGVSAPVSGYRVYSGTTLLQTLGDPAASATSITGLTNGTPYSFTLVATGPGGASDGVSASATPSPTYSEMVLASNPSAYWRLTDIATTTAADASGNSHAGVYSRSYTQNVAPLTTSAPSAVTFSNSGTVQIPSAAWNQSTSGSVEAWFKTTDASAVKWRLIAGKGGAYGLYLYGGRLIVPTQWGGSYPYASSSVSVADGRAHHAVLVYDLNVPNATKVYVDGALVLTVTAPSAGSMSNTFGIGSENGSDGNFSGTIGEVALYPTKLDAATILAHYNAGH